MSNNRKTERQPVKSWLKVTVPHPPHMVEAVAEAFFSLGAQAVWEDLPDEDGFIISRAGFDTERQAEITAQLPVALKRINEAFEDNAGLAPEYAVEDDNDWAEKWKEGLKPIIVKNVLAIKPTWWKEPLPNNPGAVLELDPGMAFGTGHHATTYMCLRALVDLLPFQKPRRILDLGAGSGILALSAALLTYNYDAPPFIVGLDNDSETVPVARENAELNNLADRAVFGDDPLSAELGPFDLILANITQMPLLYLKDSISEVCEPEGTLILSGLLNNQVVAVLEAYRQLGFAPRRILRREEWAALVLEFIGLIEPLPEELVETWV